MAKEEKKLEYPVGLMACPFCNGDASVMVRKTSIDTLGCHNADCTVQPNIAVTSIDMAEQTWNRAIQQGRDLRYDSTVDTLKHIKRVNELLIDASVELLNRAKVHDDSKLGDKEKRIFDEFILKLKNSTYGSKKYGQFLKDMKGALDHHYGNNKHHPEHYPNGIEDMDLFDIIEMLMDWKAAGERHADGNIYRSIEKNINRFKISPQLLMIFVNTIVNLEWGNLGDYLALEEKLQKQQNNRR